jgi:hypothetical protein
MLRVVINIQRYCLGTFMQYSVTWVYIVFR